MFDDSPYLRHLVRSRRLDEGRFIIEGDGLDDSFLRRLGLCTLRGRTHKRNDDFLHLVHGISFKGGNFDLYAVYDGVSLGMGYQRNGALASEAAARAVDEFFREFASLCVKAPELIHSALDYANCSLDRHTNATTAVLVFMQPSTGQCYAGAVGDSRIVIIRQGRMIPVNKPHRHPFRRNIITRKLGPDSKGRIQRERGDISIFNLRDGDVLLLASDGIENVGDEQILFSLQRSSSLQEFVEFLAELGEPKGDDRTIIAVPFRK